MGIKSVRYGNSKDNFVEAIVPATTQVVAIGSTSVQSSALGASTKLVSLAATAACHVEFGANPTATNSTSMYIPANSVVKVAVTPSTKIAVIQNSTGGNLYITEATSV